MVIAITLASAAAAVEAEDGPWEVRLRALYLDPANHSDAYALGVQAAASAGGHRSG